MKIVHDAFVSRQFSQSFKGTVITEDQLNQLETICNETPEENWENGYAPYVKIVRVYMPEILCPVVRITPENEDMVRSGYELRRKGEIPYLTRWIPRSERVQGTHSTHVNVILYSREHLVESNDTELTEGDWVIVSVNAELGETTPMSPETLLRNHMGPDFGGSGHALEVEAYQKAVDFWQHHVMIRGA